MRKFHFFLFFLLPVWLLAQDKVLKIEDFRNPKMYPTSLLALQFRGESDEFSYNDMEKNALMGGGVGKENALLLSLSDLNTALKNAGGTEQAGFPMVNWLSKDVLTFSDETSLWKYDFATKQAAKVSSWEEDAEDQDIASNGSVAYTREGNLYVYDMAAKKKTQVSKDGKYDIVYGKAAHRQEFGITKGTFWSPKGSKLAFYRMDQSKVTDYLFNDYKTTPAAEKKIKYPMAGATSHFATLGVFDLKSGKTLYLQTGEPQEQYLTNITWTPDEKYIFVAIVNRDQNEMKLCRFDANTGKLDKTLFEEKHPKYVEPEHDVIFMPDGKQFVWFSERDEWQHLYLFDWDGKLVKQLTKGEWIVEDFLGMDKKGETLFFTANRDGVISVDAYSVKVATGEIKRLTSEDGTHNVQLSKSGTYLIDNYSNPSTPGVTQLLDANGKNIKVLHTSENPLKDYQVGQVSYFPIKANDGKTDLYARLIKPVGFDPGKKYPVFVYVYGGPHAQMVHNAWLAGADMFLMYMASQGYVVFTLDNRGSGNRGLAFENATFRQLGTVEVQDQLAGIEWLKKQAWVDAGKMACFGWSFGGFMTTSMMLKQPGTFQVGVAGGPVIDWKFYEIMYTERYMDTPAQNPDGYKNSSLLNYVSDLKGKLLIIHGLMDDTVVPQHTAEFVNECIKKGVLIDYFPYPNHPHNVRGKDRIHLYKKVEDYVKRELK